MSITAPTSPAVGVVSRQQVTAALSAVRDPELDEPITDLRFVSGLEVSRDGDVEVHLRLPTYFCAANFAWTMVEDARRVLADLPGVRTVEVTLDDHFYADSINAGVAADQSFAATFDGLADGDLGPLQATFHRKAFVGRQARLMLRLRKHGVPAADQAVLRIVDLPHWPERDDYLRARETLGYSIAPEDPFLIDEHGDPVPASLAAGYLRRSQLTSVSVESNSQFCRSVLAARSLTDRERERSTT